MAHRIDEDWNEFRGIIGGRLREELKKHIKNGSIFRNRGRNGKIVVTIPQIDQPHIVFGKPEDGIGRGEGKPGDVIDKDNKGKGKGQPGTDPGDGIQVQVDLDEILKLLKNELELPDMKPKANQTYEELKVVYNGIAKLGPNSLLHKPRTMKQCMKRLSAQGLLNKKVLLPGYTEPVPILTPINDDKRFRQYNEVKIPSSNAVLFFMRDGSGSMDQYKCDIVSDISWWLDLYIKKFYKKTEVVHLWHDTQAKEVSEKNFYELRYGGGTYATSVLKMMNKIIQTRYNPIKWNIYGFYFGDGETSREDNNEFSKMLRTKLGPDVVNMFGQVEIMHFSGFGDSLKGFLDGQIGKGRLPHVRNTSIERGEGQGWYGSLPEDKRDEEIKRVIKLLLGKDADKLQADAHAAVG